MPVRIQRKRTKGWKMPPNTVAVSRPGKFGNPFTVKDAVEAGFLDSLNHPNANAFLADCFRDWLVGSDHRDWWQGPRSDAHKASIRAGIPSLRGKNLACWCALDKPCHADVLLELANGSEGDAKGTGKG